MNEETKKSLREYKTIQERIEKGGKEILQILKRNGHKVNFEQFERIVSIAYYKGRPCYSLHRHSTGHVSQPLHAPLESVDRFLKQVKRGEDVEIVLQDLKFVGNHGLCEGDLLFPLTASVKGGECEVWGDRFQLVSHGVNTRKKGLKNDKNN